MKTFSIQTLGCRVNHYESRQLAELLQRHGLVETTEGRADLQVIHTCSVTTSAAGQSRQSVRRAVRNHPSFPSGNTVAGRKSRVIVTGCWATSDRDAAQSIPGVDAVLGHHQNIARELDQLITAWKHDDASSDAAVCPPTSDSRPVPLAEKRFERAELLPGPVLDEKTDGWILQAGAPTVQLNAPIKPPTAPQVNQIFVEATQEDHFFACSTGTTTLPLLGSRQTGRQRALLKVQDGCDAHCTYCIIPKLRPRLRSKPLDDAVAEAQALVQAGHLEIVLTGIFLGAYGQETALRRRQRSSHAQGLGALIEALCTKVIGMRRLRLSSLEPGDLSDELISVLRAHRAVVPHFHLPLQSGSDPILRRMNRQYSRQDYMDMIDRVRAAFDRPALTTDVVVGFPGEDDQEFERTIEVARVAGFMHIHAFPYSPRPGTAAARWTGQFVHGPVVHERMERLRQICHQQSLAFRKSFLGERVEVIFENDRAHGAEAGSNWRHGRCQRYFDVSCNDATFRPGDCASVQIIEVTQDRTIGRRADANSPAA